MKRLLEWFGLMTIDSCIELRDLHDKGYWTLWRSKKRSIAYLLTLVPDREKAIAGLAALEEAHKP